MDARGADAAAPSGPTASPPADDVGRRAGQGARWVALSNAAKHGLDLAVFILLARHLAPDAFGLVAMAAALVVLVQAVAALGLGEALVQRQTLDAGHADTAFWCIAGVALALAAALAAAAPWIADLYGEPALAPILRGLTPVLVLQSLAVVPQALLQRDFAFRTLALRAMAASVCGGAAGIALATTGAGAWSLVAQQGVSAAVGLLALALGSRWRPGRCVTRGHAGALLRFGRSIIGTRLLNIGASKADDLVIGLVLGPVALGHYSVACRMLLALEQLFCQGIDAVALSAFARLHDRRDALRALFLRATGTAAAVAFPVFGGLALLAPELVGAVFGPAWQPSGAVLRVLLLAGALHALMHFNHAVFRACGRPDLSLRLALASTTVQAVLLLATVHWGVVAVAGAYLLRGAIVAPLGLWHVRRLIGLAPSAYLRPWWPVLGAVALGAVTVLALRGPLEAAWPPAAALAGLMVAGAAVYAAAGWRLGVAAALWPRRAAEPLARQR